jgi:hypothetical protein
LTGFLTKEPSSPRFPKTLWPKIECDRSKGHLRPEPVFVKSSKWLLLHKPEVALGRVIGLHEDRLRLTVSMSDAE